MPLYDYQCMDCGKLNEILITSTEDHPQCLDCGSGKVNKMLSAPSSLSGHTHSKFLDPLIPPVAVPPPPMQAASVPAAVAGKLPI